MRAERLSYSQRTLFALVHIVLLASLSTQFVLASMDSDSRTISPDKLFLLEVAFIAMFSSQQQKSN